MHWIFRRELAPFALRRGGQVLHLLSLRQEVHRSATCVRARATCSPLRKAKGARIPHSLRARPGGYEPDGSLVPGPGARELGRTFPRSLPPGAGTRESDEKVRRFPVAFKFNLRLNLNARARRFWVLPRTAEDSQICDLVPRPGGQGTRTIEFLCENSPPVALKFNLRLNFNARARRFWVLRRTAEDSQICDLRSAKGGTSFESSATWRRAHKSAT